MQPNEASSIAAIKPTRLIQRLPLHSWRDYDYLISERIDEHDATHIAGRRAPTALDGHCRLHYRGRGSHFEASSRRPDDEFGRPAGGNQYWPGHKGSSVDS